MMPGLCTRSKFFEYLLLILASDVFRVYSFRHSWTPNSIVTIEELVKNEGYQLFEGNKEHVDYFKVLLDEGDHLLIGGRNNVYNISMLDLTVDHNRKLEWKPNNGDQTNCKNQVDEAYKSKCQNYIQVLGKMEDGKLYVCGTNALKPTCRTYEYKEANLPMQIPEYHSEQEEEGRGKAPFDPEHNSTAIYTGGTLYSATVSDSQARDPLILKSKTQIELRTKQHQSNMLSNPHFVSSFAIDDNIYFLFRENAVENINCGKATFSRIARVCKEDKGDKYNEGVWTSFFKARLNCSIPGDIPFPFDELQATSDFTQGNFMPTKSSENRTRMFYGVFNTPDNSIEGSAVCAFTYDAVKSAFHGKFKGQATATSNWLSIPVDKAVSPHPATTCALDSKKMSDQYSRFVVGHPLMDTAVSAMGGAPVFMQTMANGRFTAIAVDWQMLAAADKVYYDILFVGTSDGRVLKAVNKGSDGPIETVVIEDIQVLRKDEPVKELKIFRQGNTEKLIVVSKENIKSIPLHRCSAHKTCRSCIALQDPYCAWKNGECISGLRGLNDIRHGDTSKCPDNGAEDETLEIEVVMTTKAPITTACPVVTCNCSQYNADILTNTSDKKINGGLRPVPDPEDSGNANAAQSRGEPCETKYIPIRTDDQVYTASTLAIASVVSIVVAALIGFVIGYRVSMCRNHTRNTEQMISFEQNFGSLRKNPNRHSINEATHNYYSDPASQKQMNNKNNLTNNVIVAQHMPQKSPNLPNGSVETKTMSPKQVSKTYL